MVTLLITVTFFLMCQQEVFTDIRFEDFKRVMAEETTVSSWSVNNISSKLKCTSLCLADSGCSALAFQAAGTCLGFKPDGLRVIPNNKMTGHGFPIYLEGRTAFLGQACTWDFQCRMINSVCYYGKCMCTPGFSYSKSTNACLRECRKYGSSFTFYEGLGIREHNDRTLLFEVAFKLQNCIDRCITETSFVCRSLDFKAHFGCYLSSSGYLDVDEKDRLRHDAGFVFGTRNCED